jgi:hypothetical protein
MSVKENLHSIQQRIVAAARRSDRQAEPVTLVAVSKRVTIESIQQAMDEGQKCFGESYLQEAIDKITLFPQSTWHFIGRIQSNKAREIAQHFDVVETVDRLKVAMVLDKHLGELGKKMGAYVQVNLGKEEQKAGIIPEDLDNLVEKFRDFSHLTLVGLMTLPPYNPDPEMGRPYFRQLRQLAQSLEAKQVVDYPLGLSMGMSGDFEVAVEEGATIVRVGTAIFGERE